MKQAILFTLFTALLLYSCKTQFATTSEKFTATEHTNSLANGKNLAFNVCGQCHYNKDVKAFTGEQIRDLPKFFGTVYSANITNRDHIGILHYTDAELYYLLKTGINREGRYVPYMIRPTMADEDVNDIIVYLRSGDAPVKGNDKKEGETHLSFLGKLASKVAGKPQPLIKGIKRPDASDDVKYGAYLVDIMGCYHCHSKSIISLDYVHPEESKGYMAGGMKWKIDDYKIRASNLMPDKETGIGNYTKLDFRKAVKEGEALHGRVLHFPMRRFSHLTDEQSDAIFAYLQTLPAKEHKVKRYEP